MSAIVNCKCNHDFQDKQYGLGKRVANETKKGELRCTVCSTTHTPRYADIGKVKAKSKKKK